MRTGAARRSTATIIGTINIYQEAHSTTFGDRQGIDKDRNGGDFAMAHESYVLITAAHNEETYIESTIHSVLNQSVRPYKWAIVSDASIDRTDEIVQMYADEHSFIELIRLDGTHKHNFAAKAHALKAGYEYLGKLDFEFIGILDADISFEPDYYEKLLVRGLEDPKLGITGGYIYERRMGVYTCRLGNRDFSVAGATQFFRRECYEAVGGICSLKYGGEDWCAEVRARMAGWTVRAMQDLQVFHHRGTGAASNLLRHRFQQGKMDFSMGSLPLFEVVKCVMRLAEGPIVVGGIARCAGFAQSYLLRESRPVSKDFIKYLRTEQKQRLIEAATHSPVQSGLHSESRPTIASDSQGKEIAQRLGHVLIIVENQPVPFDRRAWSEAAALLGKGYDVSVICPKGKNASRSFEIIDGIHIYRHWLPKETNSVFGYLLEYTVALFWEFVLSFRILEHFS